MANILNRKFIKVKDCYEYDIIYAAKYHYGDKRVKQAINRRFRRTYKQNEKDNT